MRDLSLHLRSLTDALDHLENFLHAGQVFWTRGQLPSLSLGSIYWDRQVLSGFRRRLEPTDRKRFDESERQIDRVAESWRVAWEQKAVGEARARLNLWRAYLADVADHPSEARDYALEVRNRLLAGYLIEQAGRQPETGPLARQLEGLDGRLRAHFAAGPFIWEADLAEVFPPDKHWYLYGRLGVR